MAGVTPDLWLTSQPKRTATTWLVPNYTACWEKHMGVNNLPRVVTW